jgi:hypothetical protein
MIRYLAKFPQSIPPGQVLMHNHVRHTVDMPLGLNGFRAWTETAPPSDDFKVCQCGWSGLLHYSRRPDTPCLEEIEGVNLDQVRADLSRRRYAPLVYTVNMIHSK